MRVMHTEETCQSNPSPSLGTCSARSCHENVLFYITFKMRIGGYVYFKALNAVWVFLV